MTDTGFYIATIWLVSITAVNFADADAARKEFGPNKHNAGVQLKKDNWLLGMLDQDAKYAGAEDDRDLWKGKDQTKGEEILMDGIAKNKDSRYALYKKKASLDKDSFKPLGPSPERPSSTIGKPIKVDLYDNSVDTASFSIFEGGQQFSEGSSQDEKYSRYYVLTRSSYEFRGSIAPLRSLFSAIRLRRLNARDDKDQMNTDISNISLTDKKLVYQSRMSIFPPDTRTQVVNTTEFPYSAIGRVGSGCTGTFIGPRHILTAAHCVYDIFYHRWLKNLDFQGAKTCNPDNGIYYRWKYAVITEGWKRLGWASYDFAMIVVDQRSPVWMEIGWKKPMPLYTVNINGYPGDKRGRCMWHSDCKIMKQYDMQLGYKCDTSNGMSGSSVYTQFKDTGKMVVYCVHAYGRSGGYNKCTRVTEFKFEQLKFLINEYT